MSMIVLLDSLNGNLSPCYCFIRQMLEASSPGVEKGFSGAEFLVDLLVSYSQRC